MYWTFKTGLVFLIAETTFQKSLKLSCYQWLILYTLVGRNLWYCVSENVHASIRVILQNLVTNGAVDLWIKDVKNWTNYPVQWMCNTNNG